MNCAPPELLFLEAKQTFPAPRLRGYVWRQSSGDVALNVSSLRLAVHALGVLVLICQASAALLSYVQVAALWDLADAPQAAAVFTAVGQKLQGSAVHVLGTGLRSTLATPELLIFSITAPQIAASAAFVALSAILMFSRHSIDDSIIRALMRWPLVFACAAAFAYPIYTQDFWLSAAWGRMIASGLNPYYEQFTPGSLDGLPLDHFPMAMSYGPLWGLLSGLVMMISGSNVALAGILFKLVLAAAWIGSLVAVYVVTASRPTLERALAITVFGWAPISISQSVAEGHNDVVMAALALLWFLWLMRGRSAAPLALVASVLCKYVTAPLFILDLIWKRGHHRMSLVAYAGHLALPAVLGVGVLAIFYRSLAYFDGLRLISTWEAMRPRDAIAALEIWTGLALTPLSFAVVLLFPAVALYATWAAFREPSFETMARAALAIISAIVFSAISHPWPWYLVTVLAFAAVVPRWWLARFVTGVALMAPLTLTFWWLPEWEDHKQFAALAMYGSGVLWMLVTAGVGAGRLQLEPEPARR